MHNILIVGLNHKTAPIELREKLSLTNDEIIAAIKIFKNNPIIKETIIFSTCNRVEILSIIDDKLKSVDTIKKNISEIKKIPLEQFEKSLYIYNGNDAVKHLFRVASSLDSMVVGEPQILGQIKNSYQIATLNKSSGVILNKLLHRAFFVSKKVRTETGIGGHAVSISYAAIELGKKIFGTLANKKVLLIGAGEMAELAVENLMRNKVTDIFVANRTFERGVELADRFNGKAIRFDEINNSLIIADIIISSTGSQKFIIKKDQVKAIMKSRKNRPLFFIDIAVPRDIDPEINQIDNAYVYDIDDIEGIIDENIEGRSKEAVKAEGIIDEAVIKFRKWYESLSAVPTIVALRSKIDNIAQNELNKTLQSLKHLSKDDCESLNKMIQSTINKILHEPTSFLKQNGCNIDKSQYIDFTRKLFNLDSEF